MTATLLPNAKQQFIDSNGKPLAGGSVYFYIPNTSTFKSTWQDPAQTILNANPVILDANGQAIIWGSGVYRQVVYDQFNNLIWDQITEDANAALTGDLTDDLFVAGTDFVPGTTTQLTLTADPGAVANTWVFFDGTYQGDNQIASLNYPTLTFNSPIPVGVQLVTVKIGNTVAIGKPSNGTVNDASVAQGSKLYRRITDWIDVKDPAYGAKGDGITDDTAAIISCLNSNPGKIVYFPKGTYIFKTPTTLASGNNVSMLGDGSGATTIKAVGMTLNNNGMLTWQGADGFFVEGVTFDFNNCAVTVGSEQVVGFISCTDFVFRNNSIINLIGTGLVGNSVQRFLIDNNYITKATAARTFNVGINIESAGGQSSDGVISNNTIVNTGSDFSAIRVRISGNRISGWSFGGGITTEQSPSSQNYIIENNHCFGSIGAQDVNNTYPLGIESWGAYTVLRGNQCYSNSGAGISVGGQHSIVTDNITFNNGQVSNDSGIVMRYGDANYNASFSVVANNISFDSQTPHTQSYNYQEQAGGLQYLTLLGNNFNSGALLGTLLIQSSLMSCLSPVLDFAPSITPSAIASGSSQSFVVTAAGAVLGDYIAGLSYSQDLLGCQISANVIAANSVRVTISNLTGGSQTPSPGQVRLKIMKQNVFATF